MNLVEFIERVVIKEIGQIQEAGHAYLSFGLISQSIEFLGSIIDEHDFNVQNQSKARFNSALLNLFDSPYWEFADSSNKYNLYVNLRCGLLHVLAPQAPIALTEKKDEKVISGTYKHLLAMKFDNETDERLILIAESFYEDLVIASKKVIEMLKNRNIDQKFATIKQASQHKQRTINLDSEILNTNLKKTYDADGA